ncbi:MAG TPA: sugar phosphate isomerase/epimerase family protein [Edaphobacter sp.]|nr:sugar phosphate isomerase/epimerase family protein [Edaphobacter sp.]
MQLHTRREFLVASSSLGLVAAVSTVLPRMAQGEAMGLPPGIQLYTVREDLPKDTPGTLKQLRDMGFREVETAGFGKYSVKEFRQLLDDAGLKAPSAHLNLNAPDLGPIFEQANTLGARYATSSSLATGNLPRPSAGSPGNRRPDMAPLGLDGFAKLAAQMNDIGAKAKAAGLQYAYHNHNYEFEKMPDGSYGYDILVNKTDHDLVKFEIDCGWMCAGGADPIAYFKKYPGRFKMIHVKEFEKMDHVTVSLSDRPKGKDLGQGFIDYKPIFAAGKKAGIEHAFSEQENPFPVSQMSSAKVAYVFLHASS